ncbi:Acetyltransferase (GNAT) domain-containing protein [Arenibacter palladensis]|uniref:Acetyltransferase (GNAT) domain-containing protein n=1 Tax=Arenibacter palladensis TaxID=237373 RepID=A0A1M5EJ06_9FLAO|nr:GNAT family N-acetyltransferase [Arenibacter palladensis]SHF79273.1 Acetyltransferase (GNAT) domain-containing protein [Arenibacter palladensis]
MIHRRLQKLNFYFEFFEKDSIFPFYESVNNNTNGEISVNQSTEEIGRFKNRVSIVNFIPPYLDLKINKQNAPYRAFQVKPRTGFIMDLSQYSAADEYLKSHLGSKNRRSILSRLKKLETCFDITYKNYFGEIDESEYEFLFQEFELMIGSRFEQRGDEHVGFQRWDEYKESVYDLIVENRASLFVIYDKKKPIAINLNYHFDNILDIAIPSYDIDYSKFGLGQIVLVKQLEWCFQNDIKMVDMRWGDLPYKRLWCNKIEEYKCDVVYNKNNPTNLILAFTIAKYLNIKKSMGKSKIQQLRLKFLRKNRTKNETVDKVDVVAAIRIEDLAELPSTDQIRALDLSENEYQFLRNPVYNYQYTHSAHSSDIDVYSLDNEEMSYIIAGKRKLQKLIL